MVFRNRIPGLSLQNIAFILIRLQQTCEQGVQVFAFSLDKHIIQSGNAGILFSSWCIAGNKVDTVRFPVIQCVILHMKPCGIHLHFCLEVGLGKIYLEYTGIAQCFTPVYIFEPSIPSGVHGVCSKMGVR